jgi:SAM-dependent methyltransferase
MDRSDPAYKGQSDYSRLVLNLYDTLVVGPIARYVWRFPSPLMAEHYRRHIRQPHLDVGPGTGYFIARSGLAPGSHITLLDPNRTVLDHASRHLPDFTVTAVEADVLKPLPVDGPFGSAALSLVIHCLPGPLPRKARAVANVAAVLAPDGVLFGASVLGRSARHTWMGRRFLVAFNRRGAFDNLDDTEEGLRTILADSFEQVDLEVVGGIAIFSAAMPRTSRPA